jgi:hypothetical protein
MLPMILVRNQIRDMFGGETDKITFRKFSINLGLRAKRIPVCVYKILVQWEGADSKFVGVKLMTLFVTRRHSACS